MGRRIPNLTPSEMPDRTCSDLRAAMLWRIRSDLSATGDPSAAMRYAALADGLSLIDEYSSEPWIEALSRVLKPDEMDGDLDGVYWDTLEKFHSIMRWGRP